MAYTDNFPQRPVFMADFANGGKIDPRATFSRASTANVWDGSKHLSSENLIKHSEGTAVWGGTATVTYNYTTGPDGVTATALRLESASGTERYRYSTGGQFVSGQAYTVSCWVKSNTGVAQTFRFMCSTTANQSADLTTHATDWTRVTATITPNTTNIFAGFVFLSANTNDISVWGLQVNTGSSALDYQATTTQIHREYAPSLVSKSNNIGRFDHSTDGQSIAKGILIEGQSTNLLNYSEQFDNGYWTKSDATVAASAAVAPSGELTADLATVDSTGSATTHSIERLYTFTSGTTYTFSVYAKAAGLTKFALRGGNTTTWAAETIFTLTGDGSVSVSIGSARIEPCGNGWYRCSVTGTAGASSATKLLMSFLDSGENYSFDGDDYSGVLLYGAQFEESSHSSSYLKVEGSTATRAAESLSVATADIGYTGGPVSLFCEGTAQGENTGGGQVLFAVRKDDDNRIGVWTRRNNKRIALATGGGVSSSLIESSWYDGKTALSLTTDSLSGSINGRTVLTDTSQPLPDLNGATVYVGNLDSGTVYQMNGHIKRVALYNEALSDTNLQALTS